ncbi:MAG: site-specific integrase [Deltaproteobacteria bacterium]|nr:site-specific integrase [Deltaproteobacteria bacterium]
MAILIECPGCHRKQSRAKKICKCGEDLDKAKQSKKVQYWIVYRLPGGKQKWELVYDQETGEPTTSIEYAKAAEGKRRSQKRENRILDIKPDTKMTFKELSDQYLAEEDIKGASSYRVIRIRLNNLNKAIGEKIVANIKPRDLENYRARRENQGLSDSYIDDEIITGKTVINRAFENGIVSSETYRNFKAVKKVISVGDNARNRILTVIEFNDLHRHAAPHLKPILLAGYWTGLRENDILGLTWDRVDLEKRVIHFTVKHRRRQKPKPREIYIVDALYEPLRFLERQKAGENSRVFQYKGRPVKDVTRSLKTACKGAKITYGKKSEDGFVFHDLRHTSVTDMRKAGVDPLVNRMWHGHSSGRTAHESYHTFDREDLKKVGELLTAWREEQAKAKRQIDGSQAGNL